MAKFLHGIYNCAIIKMLLSSPAVEVAPPLTVPIINPPFADNTAGCQMKKFLSFLMLLSLLFFGCNNGTPTIPNFKANVNIELVSCRAVPSPPFDMVTVFFQVRLSESNRVFCQVTELEYRFFKGGFLILTDHDMDVPFIIPGSDSVFRSGSVWFFLTEDDPFDKLWVKVVGTDANENSIRVFEGFSCGD